jgi:hypothetical protein
VRQQRSGYSGSAEVWVDGTLWQQVIAVDLTGYVEVVQLKTIGAITHVDGVTCWDGYLNGLTSKEQAQLVGKRLELRLIGGAVGRGILTEDGGGYLSGYGPTPF